MKWLYDDSASRSVFTPSSLGFAVVIFIVAPAIVRAGGTGPMARGPAARTGSEVPTSRGTASRVTKTVK
jgi:hypothetical protein